MHIYKYIHKMSVLKPIYCTTFIWWMDDVFFFGNIHAKIRHIVETHDYYFNSMFVFFSLSKETAFILNQPFVYSIMTKSKQQLKKISNIFIRTYLFKTWSFINKQTKLLLLYLKWWTNPKDRYIYIYIYKINKRKNKHRHQPF